VTEQEARTKWCVHTNAAKNPSKCDGSNCMAWRWSGEANPLRHRVGDAYQIVATEPARPDGVPPHWQWEFGDFDYQASGWVEPQSEADLRRQGFCGLAGQP